jgi:hypothetical protein
MNSLLLEEITLILIIVLSVVGFNHFQTDNPATGNSFSSSPAFCQAGQCCDSRVMNRSL